MLIKSVRGIGLGIFHLGRDIGFGEKKLIEWM
jgi:hypothetical protein